MEQYYQTPRYGRCRSIVEQRGERERYFIEVRKSGHKGSPVTYQPSRRLPDMTRKYSWGIGRWPPTDIMTIIVVSLLAPRFVFSFNSFSTQCRIRNVPQTPSTVSLFVGDRKKNMSAAERERRDEEERRRKRKDDVVIGKTSAKRGEKDFPLDPKATELEYLRQASRVEQEIYKFTEEGMECLNWFQLEDADKAFGKVFDLKPDAYLWQAGIVKFYLGDIDGAGRIFARSAETYEKRFGGPASEERIWRDACELKYLSTVAKERKKDLKDEKNRITALIPAIEDMEASDDPFSVEARKVFRLARDLFRCTVEVDKSGELLAKAKLRSVAGSDDGGLRADPKMWKLHSWFFLGLYNDCIGNFEDSKKCMKMALKSSPSSGKSEDILHTLPLLHMTIRDWFDDETLDTEVIFEDCVKSESDSSSAAQETPGTIRMVYADPLVESSIKEGVRKMKLRELKDALRLRGKKSTGSKEELQDLLFLSLMDDTGFSSGFAP